MGIFRTKVPNFSQQIENDNFRPKSEILQIVPSYGYPTSCKNRNGHTENGIPQIFAILQILHSDHIFFIKTRLEDVTQNTFKYILENYKRASSI